MPCRRFLLVLAVGLLALLPLSATVFPQATGIVVSISGTTGNAETDSLLLAAVEKGVERSLGNRIVVAESASGPVEVTLGDPSLDDTLFRPQIRCTAWLRLAYGGETFTTGVVALGRDPKEIAKELSVAVEEQLRYDALDLLPIAADGLTLDYVWRSSLSSWLDMEAVQPKKGDRMIVKGASGKSEALVVVDDILPYEDRLVAVYNPMYVGLPQPGMPLVSGPQWTGTLSFPIAIDLSGFGVGFSMMRSMSWYPWAPVLKVGTWLETTSKPRMALNGVEAYVLGGMQVDVPLGGLFGTSFTLVEDAAIGAACYVGLGARIPLDNTATSFIFGAEWEIWYRHTPSVHWGWGINFGSQYWAQVVDGQVGFLRATNLTVAPSIVFSW